MEIFKQQSKIEMRHLSFLFSMKIVGATGLGGLWALE